MSVDGAADVPSTGVPQAQPSDATTAVAESGDGPVRRVVAHRVHRPRGSGGRRRAVQVRYDDAEHTAVAAAAARSGLTVAGYVAAAALAAAEQGEPPASRALRDTLVELIAARGQARRVGVLLNQAVAALHSTGQTPTALPGAVKAATAAVRAVDDAAGLVARKISAPRGEPAVARTHQQLQRRLRRRASSPSG